MSSRAQVPGIRARSRAGAVACGPAVVSRVQVPSVPAGGSRALRPPPRGPRPGIALTALAYADAALAPRARMSPAPRTQLIAPRPQRLAYGGAAIASRVAGVALDVSASRAMDRLVRSRVWIGIIACGLIGLVAMQVSMLKLNSGIGRAVQTASTLERSNATLRAEISTLGAGDRIQHLAESAGMVMPAPADVTYLRAGAASRRRGPRGPSHAGARSGAARRARRRADAHRHATGLGHAGRRHAGHDRAGTTATGTTTTALGSTPETSTSGTTASTGTAAPTAGATAPAATPAASTQGTTAAPPTTAATATAGPTGAASGGAAPPQATAATP